MIVHDDAALARLNLALLRADYRELRDRPSGEDQLNSELDACYDEIFHVVPEAMPLVEKIKLLRAHIAKLQDALAEACNDETSHERFVELRALAVAPMLGVLIEYKVTRKR